MKKFILPIFVFVIFLSSYVLGGITHWVKLDDGKKTLIYKEKSLSYDDVIVMNESGDFKNRIDPSKYNIYIQDIEVTRKKAILGWKSTEKVVKRHIKSYKE